jgi:hypothetical protein
MIKVVDRIGRCHNAGELVYAYFDTLTEKYIVLDKHPQPTTPTIYGLYYQYEGAITPTSAYGFMVVEYSAGLECESEKAVTVFNKMGLPTSATDTNGCPAVAIRMEKFSDDKLPPNLP